jgi:hypothetical protein
MIKNENRTKKIEKIIVTSLIVFMLFPSLIAPVFAAVSSKRERILVETNQVWNSRSAIRRDTSISTVQARTYAVYPTNGGEDGFRYLQARVAISTGNPDAVSNTYVLDERDTKNTSIKILEGFLGLSTVRFSFRGNSAKHPAYADVFYQS